MHVKHTKYKLIFSILFLIFVDLLIAYTLGYNVICDKNCTPWYFWAWDRTVFIVSLIGGFLFYTIWSFLEERKY